MSKVMAGKKKVTMFSMNQVRPALVVWNVIFLSKLTIIIVHLHARIKFITPHLLEKVDRSEMDLSDL